MNDDTDYKSMTDALLALLDRIESVNSSTDFEERGRFLIQELCYQRLVVAREHGFEVVVGGMPVSGEMQ